ncbi:hypothetical protein E4U39_005773 [Claviceps sp. Clav50 group G5]|nr:hypothetical protein E4U39_005773 [Claviceps sp. Clav50 group G5]
MSSYESINPGSNIGKGKQPIYNKSGLDPRTPNPKDARVPDIAHVPAPIPTPIQAPAPKRLFVQPPKYSPGPAPKDTSSILSRNASPDFNVQQEHLGFHRYPFANIPFHIREEQLTPESHFSHQDPRPPPNTDTERSTNSGGRSDIFATPITEVMTIHDSFVMTITKVMTTRDSFYFHTGPKGYYPERHIELENRGDVFLTEFKELSDEAFEDGDGIGDPSFADLDDEDPFEYLHQELWEFSTYITEDWYRLGDKPIDLARATETELNGQIIYYLSEYMEYNLQGRLLHRRFREDFQGWNAEVWWRANKAIRTKLRSKLEQHGLLFDTNMKRVPDMLAEYVEHGQRKRPAKPSSEGTMPRPPPAPTSAPAPATAGSEKQLHPELVSPFKEKPSADPVDQTVADNDVSVAIASKENPTIPQDNEDLVGKSDEATPATELPDLEDTPADTPLIALTVSKDHAADEVRDDPLRRRRLEDSEGGFSGT